MKKALLVFVVCFGGLLVGCGGNQNISHEEELIYWASIDANVSSSYANLGDTPMAQNIEKLTGVKVKFIHPAQGQETEQFNLLLSSKQMPDIIEYNWYGFSGGPEKAINDGYILRLNDLIDKNSPNFKKYFSENPEIDKMIKTDEGSYYAFPFIRGSENLLLYNGPMVRKDWLDELGLEVPETMDDWYKMLVAFKEKKGAKTPFSAFTGNDRLKNTIFKNGDFIGAYGIVGDFYIENNKVVYGYAKPEYKELLNTFAKWRAEGLIDADIATTTSQNLDTNILTDKSGATVASAGSGLGKWMTEGIKTNPDFNLVAAPHPVLNKGEKPKFGQKDLQFHTVGMAAITSGSKNPELAAKYLDFGYGNEGIMAYNFGIEGVSYNMIENYPTYTDLILNNPEGLSIAQAMGQYIRGAYYGPFVQAKEYIEQYYQLPQQKEALDIWASDMSKYQLPRLTFTSEESDKMVRMQQNIDKYVSEYMLNVIMGKTSTDTFDAYINQLYAYGLEELLEIYNNSFERYTQR